MRKWILAAGIVLAVFAAVEGFVHGQRLELISKHQTERPPTIAAGGPRG